MDNIIELMDYKIFRDRLFKNSVRENNDGILQRELKDLITQLNESVDYTSQHWDVYEK